MRLQYRTVLIAILGGFFWLAACSNSPAVELTSTPSPLLEKDIDALVTTFLADIDPIPIITPIELSEALPSTSPPYVLDVRTLQEIQELGHIEGATAIPLSELAQRVDLLPSFDTPIVVYCRSGRRATVATVILRVLGWQEVRPLMDGSYSAWVSAGYPVVSSLPYAAQKNAATPDPSLLAFMNNVLKNAPAGWGYIDPEELYGTLESNQNLVLLDVRSSLEVARGGSIEGALQIPLDQLIERKNQWPVDKDTTIVVYGGEPIRSLIAMTILWFYDFRVVFGI